jgi:hypothetical protein
MMHIKRVPIEKLGRYLEGTRKIAVVKDGRVIGHYYPRIKEPTTALNAESELTNARPGARDHIHSLESTLQAIYKETGMTEEDLAEFFDPTLGCYCDDCTRDDE